jgi:hypothetical protein
LDWLLKADEKRMHYNQPKEKALDHDEWHQ